jgi:hypothetical protein
VCYVYHELHFLTSSIGELQPVNYNLLAIKFCKNSKSILDPKLTLRYLVKHSFKILCHFFGFNWLFSSHENEIDFVALIAFLGLISLTVTVSFLRQPL